MNKIYFHAGTAKKERDPNRVFATAGGAAAAMIEAETSPEQAASCLSC